MPTFDAALIDGYLLRLNTQEASQNTAGNYSTVNWSLQLVKGPGSGKYAGGPHYWSVYIDGQYRDGNIPSYDFRNYSILTLGSGSVNITHNADGTKSFPSSGGYDDGNAYGELSDGSVSGWTGLSPIPRATTPTFPDPMVAGTAHTINLPRAVGSFTHDVYYAFGTITQTLIAGGVGTSTSWTPPLSLINEIPNQTVGYGTLRVVTYNGGTLIGSKSVTMNISAPASMVPTFTTVTNSEATPGVAAAIGGYVKGVSKLNLALTGAAGTYGSTITGYKIEVAGQVLNTASGVTPAPIANAGTVNIVATVTDSRGRVASKTIPITVLDYSPPTITAITGQRALASGTPSETGTYIRVNMNVKAQSLIVGGSQKNTLTYKIYSRVRGTTPWTLKKTVTPAGVVTFNSYDLVNTYIVEQAYEVKVELIDKFATSVQQFTMATAEIFQHWDAARGVGIGKYRTEGMLDVLGQIYQNDGKQVVDTVGLQAAITAALVGHRVRLASIAVTAGTQTFTALTEITGTSISFTLPAAATIIYTLAINTYSSTSDEVISVQLRDGTTMIEESTQKANSSSTLASTITRQAMTGEVTLSAGAHRLNIAVSRAVGSGTVTVPRSATRPAVLTLDKLL